MLLFGYQSPYLVYHFLSTFQSPTASLLYSVHGFQLYLAVGVRSASSPCYPEVEAL